MIYLDLFLGFLRVGLFSFGGAYGAIPLIRDVVLSYGWLSEEAFSYMIAVSESTPGPIMVNLATFVGSAQGGVIGAIIATAAVVLPSFILILLLTAALNAVVQNKYVQAVLRGLRACVIGIVLATGALMVLQNLLPQGRPDAAMLLVSGLLAAAMVATRLIFKKKLPSILLICIAALLGVLVWGV
ncbi:MAG: chromate transporter [Christensenellaceae bacterium]|nr:chromate transporter [Christensenellaceae bacterium]